MSIEAKITLLVGFAAGYLVATVITVIMVVV